jgi:hypothetical protein
MNNEKNVTIEESLNANENKPVIVKMKNGRALSGTLTRDNEQFRLKLGVQFIELNVEDIARPLRAGA